MRPLLTVKAAKEQLNVSEQTIYRLVDEGVLPAVILARRRRKKLVRFRPESLEAFVRQREDGT